MESTNNKSHVLVYVDNSNIFINSMHFSAYDKKFLKNIQDPLVRVNENKLIELAARNRHIICKHSYGTLPSTELIELKRKAGILVFECPVSGFNGKEKEADTKLTADAVEDILTYNYYNQSNEPEDKTIIIFSGDKDMIPLIQTARRYGWDVEVWTYMRARSNEILKELYNRDAARFTSMTVFYLDYYFKQFTFYEVEWRQELPSYRTFVAAVPVELKTIDRLRHFIADFVSRFLKVPIAIKLEVGSHQYDGFTLIYFVIAARAQIELGNGIVYYYDINEIISKFPLLKANLTEILYFQFNIDRAIQIKTLIDFKNYAHRVKDEYLDLTVTNRYAILTEQNTREADSIDQTYKIIERKFTKPRKLMCKQGPRCYHGSACKFGHTREEEKLFVKYEKDPNYSGEKVRNRRFYKTNFCNKGKGCRYVHERFLCYYAHSESEIYCLVCRACVGHKTEYHNPPIPTI